MACNGNQVSKYYFSGLCFSAKQPLALQHRPWPLQAPSQLKESSCRNTAGDAANQELWLATRQHPAVFLPRNPSPCNCVAQRCSSLSFSFHCLSVMGRHKTPHSIGKRSEIRFSKQIGVIEPILAAPVHFHVPTARARA